tara:strand:- start:62 stop:1861 length:1800 start_codon:yes stop_codon:yes gene_type:complete
MSSTSAPTFSTFAFDVPEPDSIDGSFVYNYFLKDERTSTNPRSDAAALQRHGDKPARKVKIVFTPLNQISTLPAKPGGDIMRENDIRSNLSHILSEVDVQSENTVFVATQDDELASEMQSIIDAELIMQKASSRGLSPLEAALKYNSITSDLINAEDILDTTDIEANLNLTYYDPATGEDLTVQKQGGVSSYAVGGFYNSKFVYDIIEGSENTPFSPLWGTVESILQEASTVQSTSVSTIDSNTASFTDFEFVGNPISIVEAADGHYPSTINMAGYVITKYQVLDDGSLTEVSSQIITSLFAEEWEDEEVVYGHTYKYKIKTVFYLTSIVPQMGGENKLCTFLISSRGSPYVSIKCTETVPPPPPVNIEFFLTQEQDLMMIWDMPYNTQEDIKRFQIFRRQSLAVPYTVIAELDFDDSEILTARSEFIPEFSKIIHEAQRTDFTDSDFDFDATYYYAICSIDAHDQSSPYSTQFKVKYDRIEGKMDVKVVCFAGAPKAYPNFTLKQTLIVDCMKDSNHSKMKVYFDPETLVLKGASETLDDGSIIQYTEEYLETNSTDPMYKMQIINLDRQQDQKIDIYLKKGSDFIGEIADAIPDNST